MSQVAKAPIHVRPRYRGDGIHRILGGLIDNVGALGLGLLVIAALLPASPPMVEAVTGAPGGIPIWTFRIGPVNLIELAIAGLAVLWLLRARIGTLPISSFDRPFLGLALALAALQAISLIPNIGQAVYISADLERIALAAAGYLLVTRGLTALTHLRTFAVLLAAAITISALYTTVRYGILGETGFATITGGTALLITEDALLLIIPATLAWGALLEGRLTLWRSMGTLALVASVMTLNLLSLRRGALIMVGGSLALRSLVIGRRRLLQLGGVLLIVALLAVAAGPGRPLVSEVAYTAKSSLLQSDDDSSSQRWAEIESFTRNLSGTEWLTGKGVGMPWKAVVEAPIDVVSFGAGENPLVRLGWHVYGLDWAYKFGLLGLIAAILTSLLVLKRLPAAYRRLDSKSASILFSFSICAAPLTLMLFTNPRIALFAGVCLGLVSRCVDFSRKAELRSDQPST